MTPELEKWCGWHLMLIRGRWGLLLNEDIRSEGWIREVTPGKCLSKKMGTESGSFSKAEKWPASKKRVQVNDPSYRLLAMDTIQQEGRITKLGIAMNINSWPGQICKWWGDIRYFESGSSVVPIFLGWIWNSHQRALIYSCWYSIRVYFMRWYRTAEWAPSAPIRKSNMTSISFPRILEDDLSCCSNHALFFLKSAPVILWLKKNLTFGIDSSSSRRCLFSPARSTANIVWRNGK